MLSREQLAVVVSAALPNFENIRPCELTIEGRSYRGFRYEQRFYVLADEQPQCDLYTKVLRVDGDEGYWHFGGYWPVGLACQQPLGGYFTLIRSEHLYLPRSQPDMQHIDVTYEEERATQTAVDQHTPPRPSSPGERARATRTRVVRKRTLATRSIRYAARGMHSSYYTELAQLADERDAVIVGFCKLAPAPAEMPVMLEEPDVPGEERFTVTTAYQTATGNWAWGRRETLRLHQRGALAEFAVRMINAI